MKATRLSLMFVVVNAAFMAAATGVAAWSLWPAYGSPRYVLVAISAIAGGTLISVVAARARWTGSVTAMTVAGAYLIAGIPLTMPSGLAGGHDLAVAAGELVRGPVTGWKDIVTLPLPLGEFRATLVPVFALLLGTSALATWIAARAPRWWALASIVVAAEAVVVIAVGPSTRAGALQIGVLSSLVSREFVVGAAMLSVLLGWFVWRASDARRRAIAIAFGDSGVRLATSSRSRAMINAVSAAVMVVVSVGVATVVAAPASADRARDVARSSVEPRTVIASAVSPLASYRQYFSDDAYNAVLFTVDLHGGEADRVRIATLSYYDGEEATAAAPVGVAAGRFQHVPSRVVAPQDGMREVTADVTVGAERGVWVPLVGQLRSIEFLGSRRTALLDGFYYLADVDAGVMVAGGGLVTGDTYSAIGVVPLKPTRVADLGVPSGNASLDPDVIPPSLAAWVARQGVPNTGEGLAELVFRLRSRGYLSHAVAAGDGGTPAWQRDLGAYGFASSQAGHSYARISAIFAALNAREDEVGNSEAASLVAAVGDEEQFAVAVALIAADLGFPSRVVLGARLSATDDLGWSPEPCSAGECRGRNMSVWTEVASASGEWVPVDVGPQYELPLSPDITNQQDPKFVSAFDPKRAEPVVPPATQRGQGANDDPPVDPGPSKYAWLGTLARVVGLSALGLMVGVGPFASIMVWKGMRLRRRRRGPAADRVYQGWDQYVDAALDAGLPTLPMRTRVEVARDYGTPNGTRLAQLTDFATFSDRVTSDDLADEFWSLVDEDQRALLASRSWWGKWRARLSLRSVWAVLRTTTAMQEAAAVPLQWRSERTHATSTYGLRSVRLRSRRSTRKR